MKWYQFWVNHPTADPVVLMQRCDPILQRFSCLPCAPPPSGIPVKSADGTIEVRAYSEMGLIMGKKYLQDQGFVITNEQENE